MGEAADESTHLVIDDLEMARIREVMRDFDKAALEVVQEDASAETVDVSCGAIAEAAFIKGVTLSDRQDGTSGSSIHCTLRSGEQSLTEYSNCTAILHARS